MTLRFSVALFLFTSLVGCNPYGYKTNLYYDENHSEGMAISNPIGLKIFDNNDKGLYFLLSRRFEATDYTLHVRWISKNQKKQFKKNKGSLLHFLVDSTDTITLTPLKNSKIVAYHTDPIAIEEETIYTLTYKQLSKLANAKKVSIDLEGRHSNKVAYFTRMQTFRSFKNFLSNS